MLIWGDIFGLYLRLMAFVLPMKVSKRFYSPKKSKPNFYKRWWRAPPVHGNPASDGLTTLWHASTLSHRVGPPRHASAGDAKPDSEPFHGTLFPPRPCTHPLEAAKKCRASHAQLPQGRLADWSAAAQITPTRCSIDCVRSGPKIR
jgi:hypothetical protein